jgi:hypothetical protein
MDRMIPAIPVKVKDICGIESARICPAICIDSAMQATKPGRR